MKKLNLIGIIFVIFIVVSSLFLTSAAKSENKVESKIYSELSNKNEARVIVMLKDSLVSTSKEKTLIKSAAVNSIGKNKVKRDFTSFNGFSATLTKKEIETLSIDNNVEKIYLDKKVQAFLQQSVPLINATKIWPVQINSMNLTGAGQTVCVIDTGVNYSHVDLGACQLNNLSLSGANISYLLQSAHPYANNFDHIWKINYTGFSKIAVHFVNISLEYQGQVLGEDSYDRIIIYDSNMTEIARYHGINGTIRDMWTPVALGDTIYVRLFSDTYTNDYGFYIDQIRNGTTNNTYNWSACPKVIYGWNFVNNTGDPMDDHGHGTHVSGIVAADGVINGVSPGAKIVSAKVLDGVGSGWNSDVLAGIEFCTNISEKYNISVISMSLGDGLGYNNYCDSSDSLTAAAINAAVAKNISVVVAAGNEYPIVGISSPACIQNAIPVGATDKSDVIASYSDRNWMLKLLAPGSSIDSTWNSGGYQLDSGTSMAAPHVAGAFAIVNEYLYLTSRTKTPKQIENIFNITGKRIADSASGLNFSRIDVYSAIDYLEMPSINYSSSTDNSGLTLKRNNIYINISASDLGFKNLSIGLYNSTTLVNFTSTTANNLTINFTNLADGTYFFNATAYDIWGNSNSTLTRNITLKNSLSSLNVISPLNNTWYNAARFNVTLDFSGSCSFSLNNQVNVTMNSLNSTYFFFINSSIAVSDTNSSYNVTFYCNDTLGNFNSSQLIFFGIDKTAPVLNSTSLSKSYSSANVYYESNESVTAYVSYGLSSSLDYTFSNLVFSNSSSVALSSLSSSALYFYNLTICDATLNCVTEGTYNFTTDSAPPSGGGGGGGGGSTPSVKTYSLAGTQIVTGYTQELKSNEVINFVSVLGSSQSHSMTVNEIKSDFVNITLRSNPLNVILYVGQEKKINTTADYYDFYLKLNSIINNKANITIKEIREEIKKPVVIPVNSVIVNESNSAIPNQTNEELTSPTSNNYFYLVMALVILGLVIFITFTIINYLMQKDKNIKTVKKKR